jgi:cytochrome o ubiquinol oxidase subunit IV
MTNHAQSHDSDDIEFGSDHGSIKSYIVGFLLSIVITLVPFVAVSMHVLSDSAAIIAIVIAALIQLFVQLVFFLHLNTSSKALWNLMVFIFTLFVVLILVFGTIWIMYNLNYFMVN